MEPKHYSASLGSTSLSLLERVREHDQEAWQRLIRLYSPLLCYWCRDAELQEDDLKDLLQDVWRVVFERLEIFRNDKPDATFRGWLRVVARNKLIDFFRRRDREPIGRGGSTAVQWLQQLPGDDSSTGIPESDRSEATILLRRALNMIQRDFSDTTWQAFWRTVIQGQATRHVAEDLGMNAVAVRQARSRVLRRLRSEFDGMLE